MPLLEAAGSRAPARKSVLNVAAVKVPTERGFACLSILQPEGSGLMSAVPSPLKVSTVGVMVGIRTGLSRMNELVADTPLTATSPTRRTWARTWYVPAGNPLVFQLTAVVLKPEATSCQVVSVLLFK